MENKITKPSRNSTREEAVIAGLQRIILGHRITATVRPDRWTLATIEVKMLKIENPDVSQPWISERHPWISVCDGENWFKAEQLYDNKTHEQIW